MALQWRRTKKKKKTQLLDLTSALSGIKCGRSSFWTESVIEIFKDGKDEKVDPVSKTEAEPSFRSYQCGKSAGTAMKVDDGRKVGSNRRGRKPHHSSENRSCDSQSFMI